MVAATALHAQISWNGAGADDNWSTSDNWSPTGSPEGQNVLFTNVNETTSSAVNSVVNNPTANSTYTWTLESLTFDNSGNTANDWQNLSISSGVTLKLDAAGTPPATIFLVGGYSVAAGTITQVKISGPGSFVVNEASSDIQIANTNTNTSTNQAILDMSGLSTFSANVRNFLLGSPAPSPGLALASASGYLAMADTNTITATQFLVASGTGQGNTSTLLFGRSNTLNSNDFFIGAHGSNFTSTSPSQLSANVSFNSALSPLLSNTVTIRASDGTSRANLTIGDHGTITTNRSITANVDFSGGSVDALLNNLTIGQSRGNQSSLNGRMNATLLMDDGVMDVTTTVLGKTSAGGGGTTAPNTSTLAVFGGTFTTGAFTMGWNSGGSQDLTANLNIGGDAKFSVAGAMVVGLVTGTTANVLPTVTMNGGSLTVGGNLGESTGGANITSVFNLNGGAVDLTNHAINFNSFNARSGILMNVSQINDGGASPAAAALVKSGGYGALTLAGSNGFTGRMTVDGGTLLVNSGAMTSSGTITVNTGGAFGLNYVGLQDLLMSGRVATGSTGSIALTSATSAENIDFSAANMSTAYLGAHGNVTYSGTYTPFSAGVFRLGGGSGTLTYGANITGTNSVILGGGPGTVVLSGSNDFTGGVSLNNGTLRVTALDDLGNAANALTFDGGTLQWASGFTGDISSGRTVTFNSGGAVLDTNGNNVSLASSLGNSGIGGLTKIGQGKLTLTGLSNYTGATSVNSGTLELNLASNSTGVVSSASNLSLNGGVLSVSGAAAGTSSQTLGTLTLGTNSSNSIALDPKTGAGTSLVLSGAWTRNAGSTLNIDRSLGGVVTASTPPTLTNSILSYATVTSGGTTRFATLSGNDFAQYTSASGFGGSSNNSATNYVITGSVTKTITGAANSLEIRNTTAAQLTLNNFSVNIGSGGLLMNGTADFTIASTGGSLNSSATTELIIHHYGSGLLTINANTLDANNAGLTKTGSGTTILNGVGSTYVENTVITGGVLGVALLANGGVASSIGAGTSAADRLVINGGTLRYVGSTSSTTDRNFTVGSNGGTIESSGTGDLTIWGNMTASATSGSQTFTLGGTNTLKNRLAGNINDGAGSVTSFVKSGTGQWIVSGYNDYTGSTTVSAGTLIVDGTLARTSGVVVQEPGALGGTGTINSNVSLAAGSDLTMELNGPTAISGYDQLAINGSIDLTGANLVLALNYAPVVDKVFTLLLNDGNDAITGAFATINGAAFGTNNTFTLTYNSVSYAAQLFYTGNGESISGGNDLVVQMQAIPEPTTVTLLVSVLGVWLVVCRRRRA